MTNNQKHTILVVDDEAVSRMKLAKLLGQQYRVMTAASGAEAREILRHQDVSLIIADQRMPGMTGIDLLRETHAKSPDIICMLMSAVDDVSTFVDAIAKCGAARVIIKPWDSAKLLEDIRNSIQRYDTLIATRRSIERLKETTDGFERAN